MKKWWTVLIVLIMAGVMIPAWTDEHDDEDEGELSEREVIEFLKENLPQALSELRELKNEDPEDYEESIEGYGEHIQWYYEVREDDPKTAEAMLKAERLDYESWEVMEKYEDAESDAARKAIKDKVEKMLDEIFEARMMESAYEIRELEEEIAEIKAIMEKRRANKDKIIKKQLDDMIDDTDEDLEWW